MQNILCCSGHDPTGGAGIHADIEAVAAQGAHALTVITALTVQDTQNVSSVEAVSASSLARQLQILLADCQPNAIKLGLLGDVAQLPMLADAIRHCAVPVVMDPILRAGGGAQLVDSAFAGQVRAQLFPLCTLLTPNAAEARLWTGMQNLDRAAETLLASGVQQVLITGGDEVGEQVCNRWYQRDTAVRVFTSERVPGHFHGAGCTLASAIAARLALGETMEQALIAAQAYVHGCLQRAFRAGKGRLIPQRRAL